MISEKIYTLRRQNGLSQEQLAEKIGVSRQAISKREGGLSTPELEKLIALSECFGITLDELTADKPYASANKESTSTEEKPTKGTEVKIGIGLCFVGIIVLIIVGLATLLYPPAMEQMNESSAITINGAGLLFLFCIVIMVIGIYLILRRK